MSLWKLITSKKHIDITKNENSSEAELNFYDLCANGIGAGLAVGAVLIVGLLSCNITGPAIIVSFLIAAITALLAGFCYAEFGTRTQSCGNAYNYTYACLGEFPAFIIGWSLLADYIIGGAVLLRGFSLYLDLAIDDVMRNAFEDLGRIEITHFSNYFDFFALALAVIITAELIFANRKFSNTVYKLLQFFNLFLIIGIIILGALKAKTEKNDILSNFYPYGLEGAINGASICLFTFIGIDSLSFNQQRIINYKRAVPLSIFLSIFITFLCVGGVSTVLNIMMAYNLQNIEYPVSYAIYSVYKDATYRIITAYLCLLIIASSAYYVFTTFPKILTTMAADGLIFNFLGKNHEKYKVPILGTTIFGLLAGLLAALFEIEVLLKSLSFGIHLGFLSVSICVILIRYIESLNLNGSIAEQQQNQQHYVNGGINYTPNIFNCWKKRYPTDLTERIVSYSTLLYCILSVALTICFKYYSYDFIHNAAKITVAAILIFLMICILIAITSQPAATTITNSFKVPMVPLIPLISILINIYLIVSQTYEAWFRFLVWMIIGIPIYLYSTYKFNSISEDLPAILAYKDEDLNTNSYFNFGFELNEGNDNGTAATIYKRANDLEQAYEAVNFVLADLDTTLDNADKNYDSTSDLSSGVEDGVTVAAVVHEVQLSSPVLFDNPINYELHEEDKFVIPRVMIGKQQPEQIKDVPLQTSVTQTVKKKSPPPPPPKNSTISKAIIPKPPPLPLSEKQAVIPKPPPLPPSDFSHRILTTAEFTSPSPPTPPPPPPLLALPLNQSKSLLRNTKKPHTSQSPLDDYTTPVPDYDDNNSQPVDTIKFGTVKMNDFKNKLGGIMVGGSVQTPTLTTNKMDSRPALDMPPQPVNTSVQDAIKVPQTNSNNDVDDDDDQSFNASRQKLERFLQKSLAMRNQASKQNVNNVFNT